MFFVCLAHSVDLQLATAVQSGAIAESALSFWLLTISMIASPTFMIISGAMLGYLFATTGAGFARIRAVLADRALFMLTVVHVLILIPMTMAGRPLADSLRFLFITDAIAISIIAGLFLLPRMGRRSRIILGTGLFFVAWAALRLWHPHGAWPLAAKQALIGLESAETHVFATTFPVLPWFGVYLCATVLGELIAEWRRNLWRPNWFYRCAFIGMWMILGGIVLRALYFLMPISGQLDPALVVYRLTYPLQKFPPSLAYLLTFGGAGLVMMGAVFSLGARGYANRLIGSLAVIGQASLFVWTFQFYVYDWLLTYWLPASIAVWFLQFALSIVLIYGAAHIWLVAGGNRLLTLGLRGPITRTFADPMARRTDSARPA
jgi:hypothetical protein